MARMKRTNTHMWLSFILFHDTGRGEKSFSYTYIYHIATKNRSNIETDGNVSGDSSQARIAHLWNNEMGGQLLYELHVSRYAFLAIILQEYVSEIFSTQRSWCPALCHTLLECGSEDLGNCRVICARAAHHKPWDGPGHFLARTSQYFLRVVGRTRNGVKTFGNPSARETRDAQICFQSLVLAIWVLRAYVSSAHILWSLPSMNGNKLALHSSLQSSQLFVPQKPLSPF